MNDVEKVKEEQLQQTAEEFEKTVEWYKNQSGVLDDDVVGCFLSNYCDRNICGRFRNSYCKNLEKCTRLSKVTREVLA